MISGLRFALEDENAAVWREEVPDRCAGDARADDEEVRLLGHPGAYAPHTARITRIQFSPRILRVSLAL